MAKFTLLVDLTAFDTVKLAGVEVTVAPLTRMLPSPGDDTTYVSPEPLTRRTSVLGAATFELVAAVGLQYVVESRATGRRIIDGDRADGSTVRLEEVVSAVPSPLEPVDAASLAARIAVLEEGVIVGEGGAVPAHLHTAAQVSDFIEAAQDAVAAMLGAGSNVVLTYNDAGNQLTVAAAGDGTGLDAEAIRDVIGVALVGVGNIAVAVNDAADTITISTTATANATDAFLRDRANHTGSQPISSVTGLQAELDSKADGPGVLLIENGAEVPPGTPVGTIIFEKA
jgi:hypothetical protein